MTRCLLKGIDLSNRLNHRCRISEGVDGGIGKRRIDQSKQNARHLLIRQHQVGSTIPSAYMRKVAYLVNHRRLRSARGSRAMEQTRCFILRTVILDNSFQGARNWNTYLVLRRMRIGADVARFSSTSTAMGLGPDIIIVNKYEPLIQLQVDIDKYLNVFPSRQGLLCSNQHLRRR
ncbi:hypothetical protein PTI98_011607 [Pleurotus ostreatus]|nr:hypothetical protein PTI98_011607 [Pleurotus ostreatus]